MKTLYIILIATLFFSCKKEEDKPITKSYTITVTGNSYQEFSFYEPNGLLKIYNGSFSMQQEYVAGREVILEAAYTKGSKNVNISIKVEKDGNLIAQNTAIANVVVKFTPN